MQNAQDVDQKPTIIGRRDYNDDYSDESDSSDSESMGSIDNSNNVRSGLTFKQFKLPRQFSSKMVGMDTASDRLSALAKTNVSCSENSNYFDMFMDMIEVFLNASPKEVDPDALNATYLQSSPFKEITEIRLHVSLLSKKTNAFISFIKVLAFNMVQESEAKFFGQFFSQNIDLLLKYLKTPNRESAASSTSSFSDISEYTARLLISCFCIAAGVRSRQSDLAIFDVPRIYSKLISSFTTDYASHLYCLIGGVTRPQHRQQIDEINNYWHEHAECDKIGYMRHCVFSRIALYDWAHLRVYEPTYSTYSPTSMYHFILSPDDPVRNKLIYKLRSICCGIKDGNYFGTAQQISDVIVENEKRYIDRGSRADKSDFGKMLNEILQDFKEHKIITEVEYKNLEQDCHDKIVAILHPKKSEATSSSSSSSSALASSSQALSMFFVKPAEASSGSSRGTLSQQQDDQKPVSSRSAMKK
jgi:hypothetical protein